MADGSKVKWSSKYGHWDDPFCAGDNLENAVGSDNGQLCGETSGGAGNGVDVEVAADRLSPMS